eukprot:3232890-Rhodomonas_salina.1
MAGPGRVTSGTPAAAENASQRAKTRHTTQQAKRRHATDQSTHCWLGASAWRGEAQGAQHEQAHALGARRAQERG